MRHKKTVMCRGRNREKGRGRSIRRITRRKQGTRAGTGRQRERRLSNFSACFPFPFGIIPVSHHRLIFRWIKSSIVLKQFSCQALKADLIPLHREGISMQVAYPRDLRQSVTWMRDNLCCHPLPGVEG